MQTVLITGASGGIGAQSAKVLAKAGFKVYGGGRNMTKLEALRAEGIVPVQLDVTDDASIDNAISMIIKDAGHLDILVNNAGYGSYGAIEDVSIDEAKRQFDVNLFGLARLTQAVLPHMRAQHHGRIINTSSMGGRLTSFMGAWYHATKYALEAFSDALRMETKRFGVTVSIIEPGGIKTDWGFIAADHLAESSQGGVYEAMATKTAAGMRKQYSGRMMSDPSVVSRAILKAAQTRRPRPRYLIGFGAKPLVFAHAILPTRAFDWLMMHAS